MIKVTVLMAEYNTQEDYLRESIKSILNQSFHDFEFIIVDDGGENNLSEIIKVFNDRRIKIIKNPRNMGLVYSLNNSIKHAKGKYIVRMDTDDIAKPDRIEKLYRFIDSHKNYAVVGSRVNEFSEEGVLGVLGNAGEKFAKNVMRGDSFIHPSVIMNKDMIKAVGGYDNYNRAEDLALWCKLVLNGYRLYVIDDILLDYRVNNNDYEKRKLKYRKGEIKARFHYYPKMRAGLLEYSIILKSIISGILPIPLVQRYRSKFVLKRNKS